MYAAVRMGMIGIEMGHRGVTDGHFVPRIHLGGHLPLSGYPHTHRARTPSSLQIQQKCHSELAAVAICIRLHSLLELTPGVLTPLLHLDGLCEYSL